MGFLQALKPIVFTVFVASTLATQARLPGLNVGLGELAGVVLLLLVGPSLPVSARQRTVVLLGMAMLALGFMVGWLSNLGFGFSEFTEGRDLLALVYAMLVSLAAIGYLQGLADPLPRLAVALSAAVWVQLVPLALSLLGFDGPWWLGEDDEPGIAFLSRYTGFSTNPNQLGVLVCALPFVAMLGLRDGSARRGQRLAIWLGLIGCAAVATLIVSNTVFATYIVAGTLAALLSWNHFGEGRGVQPTRAVASVVAILLAAVALAFYVDASIEKTGDRDANGRFQRWTMAAQGISDTFLLGAGPGGQSGEVRPFDGTEAHNTLLDIALQGGLLSLAGYLLLVVVLFRRALETRSVLIICVLLAVLIQQLTHYTMRHPFNWLYMLLPLLPGGLVGSRSERGATPN
jgi:O-antigen ligase